MDGGGSLPIAGFGVQLECEKGPRPSIGFLKRARRRADFSGAASRFETEMRMGRTGVPVELPPEVAGRLGVGDGAVPVRPLVDTGRIVVLEKLEAEGPPVPWDRDLVLCADVCAFPLASVLQWVHAAGKSGFLLVEGQDCAKSVHLHAGEVVFASSDQCIDRLGNSLVRAGVVDAGAQRDAAAAYSPPGHYGRFLIERGILTPRALWEGVKRQVEDIVRSLFVLGSGRVYFWEGDVRPDNVVRLALPTGRLIEEGLWHREELLVFLARLEDPGLRLVPDRPAEADLNGAAREVLGNLGRGKSFASLCHAVGLDPLTAAGAIQLLEKMGALKVCPEAPGDRSGGDAETELRECVMQHAKLLAELLAPVVAEDGHAAVRERLAGVVEEAADRHSELLAGLELGAGGVLDPEQVVARARVYPGDREQEVRAALGELIAYAEFELLNHPRVRDADGFLHDLEPLRRNL